MQNLRMKKKKKKGNVRSARNYAKFAVYFDVRLFVVGLRRNGWCTVIISYIINKFLFLRITINYLSYSLNIFNFQVSYMIWNLYTCILLQHWQVAIFKMIIRVYQLDEKERKTKSSQKRSITWKKYSFYSRLIFSIGIINWPVVPD